MEVDISPILNEVVGIVVAVLGVLGTWVLKKVSEILDLKKNDELRIALDDAMVKALAYARERALAEGKDIAHIAVRDRMVADAVGYLMPKFIETMRHFKIDEDGLAQRLKSRMGLVNPLMKPYDGTIPGASDETS